jgi:hypothetical protein
VKRSQFNQTINRGEDFVVDSDRRSILRSAVHYAVPDRLDTKGLSLLPTRVLQHVQHAPDRFGMGGDPVGELCNRLPIATEHQLCRRPDLFD